MHVGERIRQVQARNKISGAELARRLDTSPQQVSRWRSQQDLKMGTLKKICMALEIDLDDFLNKKSPV
jgi:transcriptional regulator with XRE-family HTH domain